MDYVTIKYVHIASAMLSGSLFLLRGVWMMRESTMLQHRVVKILPHVIDTILLASALIMVYWSAQYPFVQHWLTAKVLALIAYITIGTIALKRGGTKTQRVSAFFAALLVFAYIGLVAMTKRALVFA